MKLADARVSRGGVTARTWHFEATDVKLETKESAMCLLFRLRSKGGGITGVRVHVGPKDFAAITDALVKVDRRAAMEAMSARLAAEIARQGEAEHAVARNARESVAEAASEAFEKAPADRDHAERLVMDVVRTLVDQLNSPTQPNADTAAE